MIPPSPSLRDEIRRLERLQEEEPGSLAYARLAEAYRAAGRYELALEVLEAGIDRGPPHPAGHLVEARVHHDLEHPRRERRALERALEVDPESRVARRALSELEDRLEEGEELEKEGEVEATPPAPSSDPEGRRRASHSPEERRELLAQLDRVSRDNWWKEESGGAGSGEDAADAADDGEVATETMAHLYARQGLWEQAEAVYRRLARSRPETDRLARCLEQVRNREVPGRPPRRAPGVSAASSARPPGAREGAVEPEVPEDPAEPAPARPPTMRAHLRALLRGGGAGPSRSRPAGTPAETRRPGGPRDRKEERDDAGMEELLRRWRRAARKGDAG